MNVMDELKNIANADDPKAAFHEAMEKDPLLWVRFLRRHDANIIDALFLDKDYDIKDGDIKNAVKQVADFFELPVPIIKKRTETIAEVITSDKAEECQLYYDWQEMEKSGINNREALKLACLHELAHQYLYKTRFLLFENELWIQELAADMMVGAFSAIGDDVATGKYKYVLRQLPASMTHPDGKLRAAIVEYGREYITQLRKQNQVNDIQKVLKGLPAFVYGHYQELQDSWDNVQWDDEQDDVPVESAPIDYEALPDTNLIKQYYLKHKDRKDNDI